MPNTRFGNFSELVKDKKPMTAKEAWIMLNELGLLAQEFVPGATSVRKLLEGEPREAIEELQDWIPGNAAYQNWLKGEDQDWVRNALDAMVIANPAVKGVSKAAKYIEKIPKGGKEGFINLTKPTGQNKLKDVMEASNAAGQTITPAIEKEIRDHIGMINQFTRNPSRANQKAITNHYNRVTPEAKQVIDGYLGQQQPHGFKPEGFDSWPAQDRMAYYEDQVASLPVPLEDVVDKAKQLKNENYGGHQDYGVIYKDAMTTDDYMKALLDKEAEERAAAPATEAPITMTEVQDLSTGILPSEAGVSRGGTRPTYDHSRQFMDSELKQVPGIDRTGMSYGDDTDAFYDVYKAWRDSENPREAYAKLYALRDEAIKGKKRKSASSIRSTDPYYNAGVVGDKNNKLWSKITALREAGKTDTEIRSLLKGWLNEYQGDLERFKARMPSKQNKASFDYDGAQTNTLRATPSEEARALKALGVDTPEYDELERLGDFYRVFFPQ